MSEITVCTAHKRPNKSKLFPLQVSLQLLSVYSHMKPHTCSLNTHNILLLFIFTISKSILDSF